MARPQSIVGTFVDVHTHRIYAARVVWQDGRITAIEAQTESCGAHTPYILPGFVDAHVHVESSMLVPSEFARRAVTHGTVATVSDPHEIANVLGIDGVRFMLDNAARSPLKILFGAPSCVPATPFESAGSELDAMDVDTLLSNPRIGYLSEVMNYPGVLAGDVSVAAKLDAAKRLGKPIDGHAPGLRGDDAARYFGTGITTDHECTTKDEALDKLAVGASVLIRQGSAARNFDALWTLLDEYPGRVMFCTDDLHPDDLMVGHINVLVREAVARGANLFHVLRAACVTPVEHYRLPVGLLRPGDPADFILVDDLESFQVRETVIDGITVAREGVCQFSAALPQAVNCFRATEKSTVDFAIPAESQSVRVIHALDGQLITDEAVAPCLTHNGLAIADPDQDLLKLAVTNRYQDLPPAVAFVRGFGLRHGAIASSVAHDCHNIVAVGATDEALCSATNAVIAMRGGLAVVNLGHIERLALPVAGLMSLGSCEQVAAEYTALNTMARSLGCELRAPFMTLAFMALLVIPKLKLSDRGLFDGEQFRFVPLFVP